MEEISFFYALQNMGKIDIMKKESIIIKLNVLIKDQIEQFSILLVERKILRIIEMRSNLHIKFINQDLLSLMS